MISIIKQRRIDIMIYLSFAFVVLFAFRNILHLGMFAVGDLDPFPESWDVAVQLLMSPWLPIAHGSIRLGVDIVLLTRMGLLLIIGNPSLAQKTFIMLPFFIGLSSMYIFLGRFVRSTFARYIVSFAYSFNPYSMANAIGGAIGWLYVNAFFPLIILFLLKIVDKGVSNSVRVRNALLFALLFNLAFNFGWHVVLFVIPFLLYAVLSILVTGGKDDHLKVLLVLGGAFAIAGAVILATWIPILQQVVDVSVQNLLGKVENTPLGVYYWYDPELSPVLLQIMTLQAILGRGTFGWGTPPLVITGMSLPLLAFGSLVLDKKRLDREPIPVFLALLALGTIVFIYLTYQRNILWLFRLFRPLVLLPNEGVPSLYLTFLYSPLMAISIEKIRAMKVKRESLKKAKNIFILIVLASILFLNWPFFLGDLGVFEIRPQERVFIPPHFYEIANWIKGQSMSDPDFKTLWLPYSYEEVGIKVKFLDTHLFAPPLRLEPWYLPTIFTYERQLLQITFVEEKVENFGELIAPLGIKYVIVNKRSLYTASPIQIFGERGIASSIVGRPSTFIRILDKQKDLKIVISTIDYVIYENTRYKQILSAYYLNLTNDNNILSFFNRSYVESNPEDALLLEKEKMTPVDRIYVKRIDSTTYELNFYGSTDRPIIIVLAEPYHQNWQAVIKGPNKKKLPHFAIFPGTNAFLVKSEDLSDSLSIEVSFKSDIRGHILDLLFVSSWLALIIATILASTIPLYRGRK